MPVLLPGGATLDQKVVTVTSDDTTVNTEITTQNNDGWVLNSITLWNDNTKVILFFSKTIPVPA